LLDTQTRASVLKEYRECKLALKVHRPKVFTPANDAVSPNYLHNAEETLGMTVCRAAQVKLSRSPASVRSKGPAWRIGDLKDIIIR